ncbi:sugar kinase [Sphingobacterium hungaricum]|uniref:Carbohydrate kinase n=1 Tax=Sphingobacterium hungaricum TaxID=2082723 RepID=A0A928V0I1_9SPHI|nr:sugar kinase [Sphingobacterium hungaricum]MBE8715518.1 carbohydrate kinase [Sphingobacterium hungaricum]
MKKVLCFGEVLIRQQALSADFFSSPNNKLKIYPGGSETNVAVNLSKMGTESALFTAVPKNELANQAIAYVKNWDVDVSKVKWQGDRIGSYILLSANGLSKGEVIYDRKYSSFSQLKIDDIDFEELFENVDWLHWTALTPALNPELADLMGIVLSEASKRSIFISVDLNYRNRLWQYSKEPIEVMPKLVQYCDLIMGNIWASNKMLGTSIDESFDRNTSSENYISFAEKSAKEIFTAFPRCRHIANTFRFMDSPNHNLFYGTYHTGSTHTHAAIRETNEVVDRIGSGDAFMAGLIHAIRLAKNPQEIIDIAVSAGFEKLFVEGDFGNGNY